MSCLISAKQLTKYYGAKKALDNVSFELEHGSPIALVGPNGAGKTTLFSILCGYISATSGEVSILGEKPGHANNFGKVSALPQDALLDPQFTIAKQLCFYSELQGYSGKAKLQEVERVLDLVALPEVLNEKPIALSHGMRKRVAIAQALIGQPQLILLDEATAGLDPKHARDIRAIIASLSPEITFLLSSHDLHELERLCDKVLYIENGCLKEHSVTNSESSLRYFTLRMEHAYPDLMAALHQISGVVEVEKGLEKEFIVTVNQEVEQKPDISILQLCYKNNWLYRQLINGRTLENQLF